MKHISGHRVQSYHEELCRKKLDLSFLDHNTMAIILNLPFVHCSSNHLYVVSTSTWST